MAAPPASQSQTAIVTGGSRGLGRGVVQALTARGVHVVALARDAEGLIVLAREFANIDTVVADAADELSAGRLLQEKQPDLVVLCAGASALLRPLHRHSWETFSQNWEVDAKSAFVWLRNALLLPMKPGSHIVIVSSMAAINGSPLSGSYAGAKRMLWLMADYASQVRSQNVKADSERVSDGLASAIEKARIKHVVALSSIGADKTEKTGSVIGLTHMEQKLHRIEGLNVVCLRAGYLMENTLAQIGMLQAMGKTGGPLRAEMKLPMIATRDIGSFAADALLKLNFRGKQTQELLGQRDLDMNEATAIIGKAISRPNLQYVQLPPEQVRAGLVQVGMSGNMADLLLEMSDSLNSGFMKALEKRSPKNTTPTSYELFVAETFVPLYKGKSQAV